MKRDEKKSRLLLPVGDVAKRTSKPPGLEKYATGGGALIPRRKQRLAAADADEVSHAVSAKADAAVDLIMQDHSQAYQHRSVSITEQKSYLHEFGERHATAMVEVADRQFAVAAREFSKRTYACVGVAVVCVAGMIFGPAAAMVPLGFVAAAALTPAVLDAHRKSAGGAKGG